MQIVDLTYGLNRYAMEKADDKTISIEALLAKRLNRQRLASATTTLWLRNNDRHAGENADAAIGSGSYPSSSRFRPSPSPFGRQAFPGPYMLLLDPLLDIGAPKPKIATYAKCGEVTSFDKSIDGDVVEFQIVGDLGERHDFVLNAAWFGLRFRAPPLHPLLLAQHRPPRQAHPVLASGTRSAGWA